MELAKQVENIVVGELYSYSELCKIIGAEVCSGNTRIAQKKVWDMYFTLRKVGRKFVVSEVFRTLPIDKLFKEQHTTNSAKLLLDYFMEHKDTSKFNRIEECPELFATLLFSVDLGETCGYVSEEYRYDKSVLENKKRLDTHPVSNRLATKNIHNASVCVFNKLIKETFKDLRNTLLESLLKKRVIQNYRRVLVKLVKDEYKSNRMVKPVVMSDDEVARYNLLLQDFCTKYYPDKPLSTFFFTTKHKQEFDMLLDTEFSCADIFTGYYVAFTERTVVKGLADLEKLELKEHNNGYFKSKVLEKYERRKAAEEAKLAAGKMDKHTEFRRNVFSDNVDRTSADMAMLVDEFL